MSEKPSLMTESEVLEKPDESEKARGLVPRSSVIWAVAFIVVLLLVLAIIDLTKSNKPAVEAEKTEAQEPQKAPPPPIPDELGKLADSQEKKANEENNSRPVEPNTAPSDAVRSPSPQAPLNQSAQMGSKNAANADQDPKHERAAAAAESDVFAIDPKNNSVNGLPSPQGIESARSSIQDEMRRQLGGLASTPQQSVQQEVDAMMRRYGGGPDSDQPQGAQAGRRTDQNKEFQEEISKQEIAPAVKAQAPASRNMVFQGTRIPVVLRNSLNSDLPGQAMATSITTVYDGIDLCRELIPAGTKFVGTYNSQVRPGQARMMLAFRRMIFPDGRSLELSGAGAEDSMGRSGIEGDVNNHFFEMFGNSFALALITDRLNPQNAQITTTQPDGTTSTTTLAAQVVGEIAEQMLRRNAVIAPTITVPLGTSMHITVARDMTLKPLRDKCK